MNKTEIEELLLKHSRYIDWLKNDNNNLRHQVSSLQAHTSRLQHQLATVQNMQVYR